MNIFWRGQTCFKIVVQASKGETVDILIDSIEEETGLRSQKEKADIFLSTHGAFKNIPKESFLITGPGEYEIKGIHIYGMDAPNGDDKKTIYTIEAEGIKICHLGILGKEDIPSSQIEEIGDVDILMIPIGGGNVLDAKAASGIVSQFEPKIVIPMYYNLPKLKIKLDGLQEFLNVLGIKSLQPEQKLLIKKKDLLIEEMKVVTLNP